MVGTAEFVEDGNWPLDVSDNNGNNETNNPSLVVPLEPEPDANPPPGPPTLPLVDVHCSATKYHAMSSNDRKKRHVKPGDLPGYYHGFPLDLRAELAVKVDVDSSIVVRDTYSAVVSIFGAVQPAAVVKAQVDITPNPGSFGIQLHIDDTPLKSPVNKNLKNACSYEMCEITHSNITHKLHLIVADKGLWKRKRRQILFEKRVGGKIASVLRQALDTVRRSPNTSEDDSHNLSGCNQPSTDLKASAISGGVDPSNVDNRGSPKWQLLCPLMVLIATEFDNILLNFTIPTVEEAEDLSPTQKENAYFEDLLKNNSFFMLSTAGIKSQLKLKDLVQLSPQEVAFISVTPVPDEFPGPDDPLADTYINDDKPARRLVNADGAALIEFEEVFRARMVNDPKMKEFIEHVILERLFPGLVSGPVFLDIGYLVFFTGLSHLVLLPRSKESVVSIKQLIQRQHGDPDLEMNSLRTFLSGLNSQMNAISNLERNGPELPDPAENHDENAPSAADTADDLLGDAIDQQYGPVDEADLDRDVLEVLEEFERDRTVAAIPANVNLRDDPDGHVLGRFEHRRGIDGYALRSVRANGLREHMSNDDGLSSDDDNSMYGVADDEPYHFPVARARGDTFITEEDGPGDVEELLAEAQQTVTIAGSVADAFSDDILHTQILYPNDVRNLLHRPCPTEAGYLFGTPFGNIYTGYPRIILTSLRSPNFEPPPHDSGHIACGKLLHPRDGVVSAVMYAFGLKNNSVTLTHNIKNHALNGFAAILALLVEKDVLVGKEWDTVLKRFTLMLAIVEHQQINERKFLMEAKGDKPPNHHCLRLEFRTCINVSARLDGDDVDAQLSRIPNFEMPWPLGLLSHCEVEHCERFHQFRCDSMDALLKPLITAHNYMKQPTLTPRSNIQEMASIFRYFLIGCAGVLENFVNIFSDPSNNRYLLFRNSDQLRNFYLKLKEYQIEEGQPPNVLGLTTGLCASVIEPFFRTGTNASYIDASDFLSLKTRAARIISGTPARETAEKSRARKANRLTRLELCQRDVLQKYHYKSVKLVDSNAMMLCRQKLRHMMFQCCANAPDPHSTVPDGVDYTPEERPLFLWWTHNDVNDFLQNGVLKLICDVYYHEYDILMKQNKCFAATFVGTVAGEAGVDGDDLSPEAVFEQRKDRFKKLKELIGGDARTNVGGAGYFTVGPFQGLNEFRRKASLKTKQNDSPITKIGMCVYLFCSSSSNVHYALTHLTIGPQMTFSTVFSGQRRSCLETIRIGRQGGV